MRLLLPLLLLALAACSALAQNAEPNRRLYQPPADLSAQRDRPWDAPPEAAANEDALAGPRPGNEKPAKALQPTHSSAGLAARPPALAPPPEARRRQAGAEERQKKRRRARQWRARGGEPRPRDNLVHAGGRGRLKKQRAEAAQAFAGKARGALVREERRRRRRNRKRARARPRPQLRRGQRPDEPREEPGSLGLLARALKQQVQRHEGGLEDNPLNLSMTRFGEVNSETTKILKASNLSSSYPSQLTSESEGTPKPPEATSRHQPLPVEREFSRHVEREFARSGQQRREDEDEDEDEEGENPDEQDNEDEDEQTTKRPEPLSSPIDPERVLGYSRTDEDLPILELENEVLQRTMQDYEAYMRSGPSKRRHDQPPPDDERHGDLSCVNGTFLPAPFVRHAVIKYLKSSRPGHEYLEADYECESGYAPLDGGGDASAGRLLCHGRRWVGRLPTCSRRSDAEDAGPSCEELACEQLCRLIDGRPQCSCRQGFRLEGATCVDVDECEANGGRGPCEVGCRNLEGGFECGCEARAGARLAPDGRSCEPPSCDRDNAGCSHTCLASMGRVFCLCPDGFMLEDDWKTCQDVNECAVPELQTELCRHGCINTPGSYRCAPAPVDHPFVRQQIAPTTSADCQPGYQLNPLMKNCIDVDECATSNGGCSEICENTEGSFFCACEGDERVLAADRRSCVVAEQRFEKMDREAALATARLRQVVSCSPLNPVGRGYLQCSDREPSAEEASAASSEEEPGDEEPPGDGGRRRLLPIRPGTKCHLKCPRGYELHGEYELTCRADGTWDGPKHGECLRYSKPRLDCPRAVLAELPPGRDEAFVTYEQPSTDLDWFRYVRSKPSWGTRLEANLKLGLHQISFYARHPVSKKQASCSLNITVQEGQAPKVDNCPSDIEVTGRNGSAISWTEPLFTDNVKVTRVSSTQSPGQTFSLGGHKVEYEAADEAGWTTKCIFTVVLRPL